MPRGQALVMLGRRSGGMLISSLGVRNSSSSSLPAAAAAAAIEDQRLKGLRIAVTTPTNYAGRLIQGLLKDGAQPISCPTIAVERTPQIIADFHKTISPLDKFKGIAFTSRSAIASFAEALAEKPPQLDRKAEEFLVGSLGNDAELIRELNLFKEMKIKLVVPPVATPLDLVEELGDGHGRKLLCPVPLVMGLNEPEVIPDFLKGLKQRGWDPVRLTAYITRWTGRDCIKPLLHGVTAEEGVDALLLTSSAEVEGLLKSLDAHRLTLENIRNCRRGKRCLLVAYGPVTASGARQLGVDVDLVGTQFHSFTDLIELLASSLHRFAKSSSSPSSSAASSASQ